MKDIETDNYCHRWEAWRYIITPKLKAAMIDSAQLQGALAEIALHSSTLNNYLKHNLLLQMMHWIIFTIDVVICEIIENFIVLPQRN